MKILYVDTETTGTDPVKNDIVQIALIFEIDRVKFWEENYFCQPFSYDNIDDGALEVNGLTVDQFKTFDDPRDVYKKINMKFGSLMDKFDKADKFYPAGYNVQFDINFLNQFYKKNRDNYFGSYCNWKQIDPRPMLYIQDLLGKISLPNYKLETVCDHFGIKIDAHDALSDIRATRVLIKQLIPELNNDKKENI